VRRAIVLVAAGLLVLCAPAVRAQHTKLALIGYLGQSTPIAEGQRMAAFVQRLRELGWVEGQNVAIEVRWAEGRTERSAEIATEFVGLKVHVIVTAGTPQVLAAKQATSAVPIVAATMGDPISTGLITNLARPGGNVTGLSGTGRGSGRQAVRNLARSSTGSQACRPYREYRKSSGRAGVARA
jgi:putative tryptophan/tyrosine transport system substrate-binding protein